MFLFLYLEMTYDRVQRGKMWKVMEGYGINEWNRLLNVIKASYRYSGVCFKI